VPGILEPGESGRVPVYWAGWLRPWQSGPIKFKLATVQSDSAEPVDWAALGGQMRPPSVSEEAWNVVFANFTNQVGGTWGDCVRMLTDNARHLDGLGQRVVDVGQLLDFEFYQANGFAPCSWIPVGFQPCLLQAHFPTLSPGTTGPGLGTQLGNLAPRPS
jgi:hypothetical protein